MEFLRLKYH